MKGTRLIVLILSILLLTMSSGLLFYKNLFSIGTPATPNGAKVDFTELRLADYQINATQALMRRNLSLDQTQLDEETNHLKELLFILSDIKPNTQDLGSSMKKIEDYYNTKVKALAQFQSSLNVLKNSLGSLNGAYNDLLRANIKFTVDKKDFYRECLIDALYYVSMPNKLYETKMNEDRKILGQIISFATVPNPLVIKYNKLIEGIYSSVNQLESVTPSFTSDPSIIKEMAVIEKHFKEAKEQNERDGQIFLTMVFSAIVIYLIAVVTIIKRLT